MKIVTRGLGGTSGRLLTRGYASGAAPVVRVYPTNVISDPDNPPKRKPGTPDPNMTTAKRK